ncbi:MAG: OB-fold domain-containing protein [Christensenellaceae bacterium]|jgi:uncharacterized OB-fold protein|nr:OB-fold domain-containing protein [Christensenellaceae bacterium]
MIHIPPKISCDTAPFWAACNERTLQLRQCEACGHIYWPAAPFCPACASANVKWQKLTGEGTVFSYVVFRQAFDARLQEAIPYVVAVIRLREGPKIVSNILCCPPEKIFIDMPVRVAWSEEGIQRVPQFVPCGTGAKA